MMKDIHTQRNVLMKLTEWRNEEARKRGVPDYLILPNTTINAIAQAVPTTDEELVLIKGFKEAKLREFGSSIKAIIQSVVQSKTKLDTSDTSKAAEPDAQDQGGALRVSLYLDVVNRALRMTGQVRIVGEVGQVKEQGNAIYFSLKDGEDGSTISMFMWKRDYLTFGTTLEEGMEVIATGVSEVYKPTGRLSFRADAIELVGEGALKKAYEVLKKTLDAEGLFSPERKRPLPNFPHHIGLITSRTGAVIHDFLNNLGKFGYKIHFCDSRVEGILAVNDILHAIKSMKHEEIDTLVIIRGGGSLESLQAFNNEQVVRAIREFPVPVICAIGHDQDIPLAQLAADHAPSTPTACTILLNKNWNEVSASLTIAEQRLHDVLSQLFVTQRDALAQLERNTLQHFYRYTQHARTIIERTVQAVQHIERRLIETKNFLSDSQHAIPRNFALALERRTQELLRIESIITQSDPRRLVSLGYALVRHQHEYIGSASQLSSGDRFALEMKDGTIDAQVIQITAHEHKNHKTEGK